MRKGVFMDYIDLESVGSTVTNEGVVFPQDISESPVTASDADEMMGVSIFEVCDEWITNLSCEDLTSLVSFLDENIGWTSDSQIHGGYEEWRTAIWTLWENVNNCYMNLDSMAVA
jgi:hypothetical protein